MTIGKTTDAGNLFFRRFFIRILLVVAAAAFLLRLGVSWEMSQINGGLNNMLKPPQASDLHTYIRLGQEITRGQWPKEFYYQPFYYAVFLPLIYLFTHFSLWAVAVIQSFLGGLTVFLTGLAGKELFGRTAGIIAAVFAAISTPLLLYAPFHQNETLQCFNLTLLFFLLLRALRKKDHLSWGAVGVVAGIATLTRGNILLFMPLLLLALWLARGISRRQKLISSAVLLALFLLVQLPFIIYNTRSRGLLTGPSTAADAVLALGNTPEAPPGGRNAGLPAGPMEYPQSFHDFMALTSQGRSVPRQMLEWMCREPGAFFELQFRKLLLFWDGRELPNNVSLYGEGEYSNILKLLLPGRSHVLLSFALAGMFFFAGSLFNARMKKRSWLYCFIIFYWGAIAVFYILSRFRAPILPLTAIFAGAFISTVLFKWKKWERQKKALALLALASGIFITTGAYDHYADNLEPVLMRYCRPAGTLVKDGLLDNGPFTCGAWTPVDLQPGTRLAKHFAVSGKSGRIQWQIFSPEGWLIFKVNGREYSYKLSSQGSNIVAFDAPSEFEIEIISAPEKCAAVFDRRRDYGRSSLNGETIPAEWVMRFTF